jgi:hypothetical protein
VQAPAVERERVVDGVLASVQIDALRTRAHQLEGSVGGPQRGRKTVADSRHSAAGHRVELGQPKRQAGVVRQAHGGTHRRGHAGCRVLAEDPRDRRIPRGAREHAPRVWVTVRRDDAQVSMRRSQQRPDPLPPTALAWIGDSGPEQGGSVGEVTDGPPVLGEIGDVVGGAEVARQHPSAERPISDCLLPGRPAVQIGLVADLEPDDARRGQDVLGLSGPGAGELRRSGDQVQVEDHAQPDRTDNICGVADVDLGEAERPPREPVGPRHVEGVIRGVTADPQHERRVAGHVNERDHAPEQGQVALVERQRPVLRREAEERRRHRRQRSMPGDRDRHVGRWWGDGHRGRARRRVRQDHCPRVARADTATAGKGAQRRHGRDAAQAQTDPGRGRNGGHSAFPAR